MSNTKSNTGDIIYIKSNVLRDKIYRDIKIDTSEYEYIEAKINNISENDVSVFIFKGTKYNYTVPAHSIYTHIPNAKICHYDDENYKLGDKIYMSFIADGNCYIEGTIIKAKCILEKYGDCYSVRTRVGDSLAIPPERIYKYSTLISNYECV